jgi:hypothetical protein
MRVASEFHKIASPLLYRNVIVKGVNGMSKVLAQHQLADNDEDDAPKTTLLSKVRQLTLLTHTCRMNTLSTDSLPNLQTLIIIPRATCRRAKWICSKRSCPIFYECRVNKLVFHNSRRNYERGNPNQETVFWPLGVYELDMSCSILTLVIDDAEPTGAIHWRYQLMRYEALTAANGYPGRPDADEVRIIVLSQTPAWVDKIAQREPCRCDVADVYILATHILAQVIREIEGVNVYLFRPIDPNGDFLARLDQAIRDELDMLGVQLRADPGTYFLKTLADYSEEGVEDELLPEELQYWRGENMRRLAMDKESASGTIEESVSHVSVPGHD